MNFDAWSVPLPAAMQTADGEHRRIGVELEMIGLSVSDVSQIVATRLNGKVREDTPYEHFVTGDDAGEWGVELDYGYLKELGREQPADVEILALINEVAEGVLRAGAEAVVPVEIVSPPLPMQRLADIQALIARLRTAGAKGSGAGVTYAFGMQFNPELPNLEADTISRYLKAFFCLYDWLAARSKVDLTRRLTGFSAAFPERYVRQVVDPEYWPEQSQLIDDYLSENPTRNRALDMLPLFMHLDEKRLRAVVDDPRVKPRPTLHYRLPNCEIDREDWGVHLAWGDWLVVESLAADRERLDKLCSNYASWLDKPLGRLFDNWADEVAAMPEVNGGA
ncbi:MAG: amidoligase family protein [Woeseia sp.]